MAEKKEKQYVSDNAQLMAEWNWDKNTAEGFDPHQLTCGSGRKAWWKCSNGHEWQSRIADKSKGDGCPYCSGLYAVKGKNDLQTVNPILAKEWNKDKNGNEKPEDFTANSHKKVWWKCHKGHEWQASIKSRNKGSGCPYCSGLYAVRGENDLQTLNPALASEWNYDKNVNLTPDLFTVNSGRKVWWKCSKGHEWQAKIYSRNSGNGCPICSSERNTSFPEFALVYYLKRNNIDVIHSYQDLGYELDVFIPSKNIAIEYDGYFWHKRKAKEDLDKNQKCAKDGIKLYRIREGLQALNDSSIDHIICRTQEDLGKILELILSEIIGTAIDVDLNRDAIAIENLREYTEKENSIVFLNPEVANEWNYEKNGKLRPENFTANSHKKVWWICSKGHEWQGQIDNRRKGHGCPYCAGRVAVIGENDLHTLSPELSKEWNQERNIGLAPETVLPNSGKKVWWKCSEGHEWQATIASRHRGDGCPYCSGRRVLKGYNDLQTINPTLAREWHYEKNIGLTPVDVTPNSNKQVWWKCSKGHEWESAIFNRNRGNGCPYCSGRRVLPGFNDLQTVNSSLANEWNYERNGDLKPDLFTANSNKKVWWKCTKGHEWETRIIHRNNGCGCPQCARENRKRKN